MECCICNHKYKIFLYKSLARSITAEDKLSSNKEKYELWLVQRVKHGKNVVSSGKTFRYFILIIEKEKVNILGNAILLHATTVAEEVHLIHLLLVLRLQLIPLSSKPNLKLLHLLLSHESSPELLHLLLQLSIFLLSLFEFGLRGPTFLPQLVRLDTDRFLLPFSQLQSFSSLHSSLLSDGKIALHSLQFCMQLFIVAHTVGDESPHSLKKPPAAQKVEHADALCCRLRLPPEGNNERKIRTGYSSSRYHEMRKAEKKYHFHNLLHCAIL